MTHQQVMQGAEEKGAFAGPSVLCLLQLPALIAGWVVANHHKLYIYKYIFLSNAIFGTLLFCAFARAMGSAKVQADIEAGRQEGYRKMDAQPGIKRWLGGGRAEIDRGFSKVIGRMYLMVLGPMLISWLSCFGYDSWCHMPIDKHGAGGCHGPGQWW